MKKVAFDDIDPLERATLSKSMFTDGLYIFISVLVDKLGSDNALRALEPYARHSACAITQNLSNIFGVEGTDIERIADVSELLEFLSGNPEGLSYDMESSPERIIRAGYVSCQNRSAPKEFCIWAHERLLNGICETINPEYECRFTQMITKGDPICSYVIEKKKKN